MLQDDLFAVLKNFIKLLTSCGAQELFCNQDILPDGLKDCTVCLTVNCNMYIYKPVPLSPIAEASIMRFVMRGPKHFINDFCSMLIYNLEIAEYYMNISNESFFEYYMLIIIWSNVVRPFLFNGFDNLRPFWIT